MAILVRCHLPRWKSDAKATKTWNIPCTCIYDSVHDKLWGLGCYLFEHTIIQAIYLKPSTIVNTTIYVGIQQKTRMNFHIIYRHFSQVAGQWLNAFFPINWCRRDHTFSTFSCSINQYHPLNKCSSPSIKSECYMWVPWLGLGLGLGLAVRVGSFWCSGYWSQSPEAEEAIKEAVAFIWLQSQGISEQKKRTHSFNNFFMHSIIIATNR